MYNTHKVKIKLKNCFYLDGYIYTFIHAYIHIREWFIEYINNIYFKKKTQICKKNTNNVIELWIKHGNKRLLERETRCLISLINGKIQKKREVSYLSNE